MAAGGPASRGSSGPYPQFEADNVLTENVVGSAFDDTLAGNGGVNRLLGLAGDDEIRGGGSGDTADGGPWPSG